MGAASASPKPPLALQCPSSSLLRPSSSRDGPRLGVTPAFCSGGDVGKERRASRRTRPGGLGAGGRSPEGRVRGSHSPGNQARGVLGPSATPLAPAGQARRRGQRGAPTTAPGGGPPGTGARAAAPSPPGVAPPRDGPERPPTRRVPPALSHGRGHALGAATCAGRAAGRTGLELRPPPPPPAGSRLRAAAPGLRDARPRPLRAPRGARCARLDPPPPALVLPGRGGGAVAPTCSAGSCPGAAAGAGGVSPEPGRRGARLRDGVPTKSPLPREWGLGEAEARAAHGSASLLRGHSAPSVYPEVF